MQRISDLFFRIYLCLSRDLSTSMFFCCSIYIETAQISREECNELADLFFIRLSLCLSTDFLSCDTRSLDLCILFKFIFLYLWYIPPHSCALFTHFTLHQFFSYVYYHAKYFSYPWRRLIWTNFFFLTFIALIQWNFPWNISANLLIFTNKASSQVVVV